jgi:hypothetical protein
MAGIPARSTAALGSYEGSSLSSELTPIVFLEVTVSLSPRGHMGCINHSHLFLGVRCSPLSWQMVLRHFYALLGQAYGVPPGAGKIRVAYDGHQQPT